MKQINKTLLITTIVLCVIVFGAIAQTLYRQSQILAYAKELSLMEYENIQDADDATKLYDDLIVKEKELDRLLMNEPILNISLISSNACLEDKSGKGGCGSAGNVSEFLNNYRNALLQGLQDRQEAYSRIRSTDCSWCKTLPTTPQNWIRPSNPLPAAGSRG